MRNGFFKIIFALGLTATTAVLSSCTGKSDGVAPSASTGSNLIISPNAITLASTNVHTFTASGGSGSYSYSIASGSGSVVSTTGVYTAPAGAGTDVVRVVDGTGKYADAIVTVVAFLQISPVSQSVGCFKWHDCI